MTAASTSRRAVLAGLALLAALPAAASAQAPLAPSLALDQRFAPGDGIARDDLNGGLTDIPSAVAVDGDRIIVAGETRDSSSNSDVGIVVRLANGSYDTSFSGDGKLILPIAADGGKDVGSSVVVLPDGRLRILITTDTTAGTGTNLDIGVVGLARDGSFDTSFGGGDGVVTFAVGTTTDTPTRMVAGPGGRLAIAGARSDGSKEDSFVALLEADGSPVGGFGANGVAAFDRAGTALNDRAVDVAFRPGGGVVALLQVETNPDASVNDYQAVLRALTLSGAPDPGFSDDGDLVLAVGEPDTVPGAVLAHGDNLWVSGATKVGSDTDAFLGRLRADGTGLEFRRFDMRGALVPADQVVTSAASDLGILPGTPATLVATGSVNVGSRPYWSAAAFAAIDGPVAAMPASDLVLPTEEYGAAVGVGVGDGWVAVAGSLVNTSQNFDTSYGTARLLVDADKACDLALDVTRPLEARMAPGAAAPMTVVARNAGTKPCGGVLSTAGPWSLRGATTVPVLAAGASHTAQLELVDGGALRRQDTVTVSLKAAGDGNAANDSEQVPVAFRWCSLTVEPVRAPRHLPADGGLRVEVTVRNRGTITCERVRLTADGGGRRLDAADRYDIAPGRSVSDVIELGAARGARRGATVTAVVRALADAPVADSPALRLRAKVARTGDTGIRAVSSRALSGTASAGDPALGRRGRAVRSVEVAVLRRAGKRCRWLSSTSGRFTAGSCSRPRWVKAEGTTQWRLSLRARMSAGTYEVRSRAVLANGFREAAFSTNDRNLRRLSVR